MTYGRRLLVYCRPCLTSVSCRWKPLGRQDRCQIRRPWHRRLVSTKATSPPSQRRSLADTATSARPDRFNWSASAAPSIWLIPTFACRTVRSPPATSVSVPECIIDRGRPVTSVSKSVALSAVPSLGSVSKYSRIGCVVAAVQSWSTGVWRCDSSVAILSTAWVVVGEFPVEFLLNPRQDLSPLAVTRDQPASPRRVDRPELAILTKVRFPFLSRCAHGAGCPSRVVR